MEPLSTALEFRYMTKLIRPPLSPDDLNSLETEIKYVAPVHRTPLALRLLEQMYDPDPKFPFGIVSSIYYDAQNWDYLREKRNSDYLKTKVRLRWYENASATKEGADLSHAEIKYRIGSKRMKIRMPTEYTGRYLAGITLDNAELLKIPTALAAGGARIRQPIFPAFTIRYCRRRFVDRFTSARICLDYDISSPKSNPLMLGTTFPCVLRKTVLEIKGTGGEFPLGLKTLLKLGFRKESFSKYYECYGQLTRTFF